MTDYARAKAFVDKLPMTRMSPDELAHSGILGMHWGVRNSESVARESRQGQHIRNTQRKLAVGTLGASVAIPATAAAIKRRNQAVKNAQSADHKTSRELKKKHPSNLSNADIQKVIDRLQKEKTLKQLDPSNVARGKKIALGIVAAAGTAATVYNLINSPAGKAAVARGAKIAAAILAKSA